MSSRHPDPSELIGFMRQIYDAMVSAAEAGVIAPSNFDLGRRLGCGISRPSEGLRRLETLGYVRVKRFGTAREVEIVASASGWC